MLSHKKAACIVISILTLMMIMLSCVEQPSLPETTSGVMPPMKQVQNLANTLQSKIKLVCESTNKITDTPTNSGAILVVWADSGDLVTDVQQLLANSAQPTIEQDITFIASIERRNIIESTYTDGQPGYRIDYNVKLLLYSEVQIINDFILEGYPPPFSKSGTGPAYGAPPRENVAGWLGEQTGNRVRGAIGSHWKPVNCVAFSPDGTLLASSSEDGTICIWEVASGDKIRTISGHDASGDASRDIAFSPDGSLLAYVGDSLDVRLYDLASATIQSSIQIGYFGYGINSVAFSPRGETLATGGWLCGGVSLWDISTGKNIAAFSDETSAGFVAFSPDGEMLVSESLSGNDYSIVVWEVLKQKELWQLPVDDTPHYATFSPDSKKLAVADWGGYVTIWDISSQLELTTINHNDWIYEVEFSPDGKLLAFGGRDGKMLVVDAVSGTNIFSSSQYGAVKSVSWSPDGKLLAFAGDDCLVRIWDTQKQQPIIWP